MMSRQEQDPRLGDGLQMAAAQVLLVAAADAFLAAGRGPRGASLVARIPALVAPAAAAAHLTHAYRPTQRTESAVRVLDTAVMAIGAASTIAGAISGAAGRGTARGRFAVPSLVVASAGLLGLVLDARERREAEARRRLERRANLVERLVPRTRRRLDHVVVHV